MGSQIVIPSGYLLAPLRPWTPADITTNSWWDAADSGTITESAGFVSQWDDKSGNNRHLVQATGSKQPTYTGSDTITFDENRADNMTSNYTRDDVTSFYIVYNSEPTDTTHILYSDDWNYAFKAIENSTDTNMYSGFGSPSVYQNGGLVTPANAGDNWDLVSSGRTLLEHVDADLVNWTKFMIGDYNNTGHNWALDGGVNELIIVDGAADTAERQKIEGYLADKWSLTLAIGHPYENGGPMV